LNFLFYQKSISTGSKDIKVKYGGNYLTQLKMLSKVGNILIISLSHLKNTKFFDQFILENEFADTINHFMDSIVLITKEENKNISVMTLKTCQEDFEFQVNLTKDGDIEYINSC
jgi:hypothetical protein